MFRHAVRTTVVFVASSLTAALFPLGTQAAAASTPQAGKARDLPALASAEQKKHVPEVPEGDFRNPPPQEGGPGRVEKDHSKSYDPVKSKLSKRTAKADIYANEDGTETAVVRTSDVNWQDAAGKWHPTDPNLVKDGSRWKNSGSRVAVRLAGTSGDGPLAEVAADGWSIAYDVEGAAAGVKPTVKDDRAKYKGLLGAGEIDVIERVLAQGLKEEVLLHHQPAGADDLVLRFPLAMQGVSAAAQEDGTIAFTTAAGETVAVAPKSVVWDAEEAPAEGEGLVLPLAVVPSAAGGQAIEVRVPRTYLADPARRYPVRIDPTIDAGHATTQYDAFGSSPDPNGNYNGAAQWDGSAYVNFVGYHNYPTSQQYTYQYFDLGPVMGATILDAQWREFAFEARGDTYYRLYPVGDTAWNDTTIRWNNLPNHRPEYKEGWGTTGAWQYQNVTDWVRNWANGTWTNRGISLDSAGHNSFVKLAATEQGSTLNEAIFITYNRAPTPGQPTGPANGSILMTEQPTFTGTTGSDPDGDGLSYWFRVSTNADGWSGSLLNSGGIGSPNWTPPAGSLVDGTTYYWTMYTGDGVHWIPTAVQSFKVNLRLGKQDVSPMETVGPASVNLANGNVVVQKSSPSFDTVGGGTGISYSYNSKAQQQYGLMGTYTGNPTYDRLTRRDPVLDFNWGNGSPGPGVPADNFDVTWSGYITVPYQATNWYFGAVHDDDVTITVNNTTVYSAGCCRGFGDPGFGTWLSLLGGHTVPITITLHEGGGQTYFQLWTAGPRYGVVPANWLSTTPPPLPQGWSMSVDAGGGELSYSKAVIGDNSLVLHEPSGVVHEYRRQSDLSWRPVVGDDDVVVTGSEGGTTVFVVQGSDGIVYTFNNKGQLIRAVTNADDRNPAAPTYEYNTTTARLKAIVDPVSGKRIELKYAFPPDGGTTVTTDCPKNSGAGFNVDPPIGMLCQITYWDGSTTNLYYLGDIAENRVLARIEDRGGVVTDFAYDAAGRLTKMRDPLAADLVAAGVRADDDTTRTVVAYDGSGRASGVTLPAPLAGDLRPAGTFGYVSGTQTDVHTAGLSEPNGYARRVTFDGAGRMLTERDTAGLLTSYSYDNEDKLLSVVEPTGLKSTTVYDHADRAVESHGPALGSCFGVAPSEPGWTGERPNGTCTNPAVPVGRTGYDEGMRGLAAEYWANPDQAGASALHALGVGPAGGELNVDWGYGAPSGLSVVDWWSARFTGDITFPQSGTYGLKLCADDGVRLFVDDDKLVDDWILTGTKCRTTSTVSGAANTRKRIRVDYYEAHSPANVALYWTPPGAGEQVVPGQYLAPRYGLVTSSTDPDNKKTAAEYTRPEYGQATATAVDPAGLNLRTVTNYEAPGTGYFRRTSKALPKGNATTFAYYASGESAPSNECGGIAATGLQKSETGPSPAGGSALTSRAVYDSLHRVVGRKVDGDARWSCTSYDSRGRATSSTDASNKTTSMTYTTPGQVTISYPDSGGTARSTVEKVDLLGRTWSYTDEHGTVTRRTFDQVGRAVAVFRTFSGQSEVKITEDAYNSQGRLASTTEYVSGAARTTTYGYDSAGRLTTTTRPNGVVTTMGFDPNRGDTTSLAHTGSAMTASNWTYTRSAARRVSSEATTGRTRNFTYDGAGRLTRAVEGAATRDYAYDANTNRCARATSCASPTYTYDNADRVTSSPEYSSYAYNGRGNMTSAVARTQPAGGSLNQSFSLNPAAPSSFEIIAGQAGTVSANLDWTGSGPTYTTQTATGSLAASATRTTTVPVDGLSYVTSDLTWTQGSRTATTSITGSVSPGSPVTKTLPVTATGTISASTNWSSSSTSGAWSGSVANLGQNDRDIVVSANGTISTNLSWPSALPNPNLDLELVYAGSVVAVSNQLTGNSEAITYNVTGMPAYPGTRIYTLRVKAVGAGSSYNLSASWPVTADVDLELYNPSGTKVAQATSSSAKPESLSYAVTSGNTGTYSVKVLSKDFSASLSSGTASYPELAYANLTMNLKNPSGTVVTSTTSGSGAASLTYRAASGGNYTLQLVNNSSDVSVPSLSMPWSTTMQGNDSWSGTSVPVSGTRTKAVTLDGDGWVTSDMTWTQGSRPQTDSISGSVPAGGSTNRTLAANATGTISASTDWSSSSTSNTWSGTVANLGQNDRDIVASANGSISSTLTWPSAVPNPNLDLELWTGGTLVASSTLLTGNSESLSYNVTGIGAYPASRTYTLRVKAIGAGSSYNLSASWPVTADVDLELYNPSGTKVAQATGTTTKPETLSYTVTSGNTGNYTLKVLSKNHSASFTGSATYPVLAYANVSLRLKNPSGTTVATATGSGGSTTLNHRATVGGTWTLELVNNSSDLTVPSFSATTRLPRTHTTALLQLKNAAGTVVAENASSDRPKSLTTAVAAGRYSLVVTPSGTGTGTLTATYPGRLAKQVITYDANDHATSVDDGTTLVSETLSPSGRAIRRTVRDSVTQDLVEDVLVGYGDNGDSPYYFKPVAGGTVTTFLSGVVYTGTTAAWELSNLHGDVVGTTDNAGAFTAAPVTDEFGVGTAPASRLGWLGAHDRFSVGGSLGLVRMGVRLYDPSLGRFTAVDPVEGGSANDYDYCAADPVNCLDLDGRAFIVIGIVVVVGVVAVVGMTAHGANQAAKPKWKKEGLSRCPTRQECATATKLLKGAIGYANKLNLKLSKKALDKLRRIINDGGIRLSDASWLRPEFPSIFGNRQLKTIQAICKDAYGGNW